jgi:hypothetical protein
MIQQQELFCSSYAYTITARTIHKSLSTALCSSLIPGALDLVLVLAGGGPVVVGLEVDIGSEVDSPLAGEASVELAQEIEVPEVAIKYQHRL